jgi:hypothetical protein
VGKSRGSVGKPRVSPFHPRPFGGGYHGALAILPVSLATPLIPASPTFPLTAQADAIRFPLCGRSSVGRASRSQRECRRFEPVRPLLKIEDGPVSHDAGLCHWVSSLDGCHHLIATATFHFGARLGRQMPFVPTPPWLRGRLWVSGGWRHAFWELNLQSAIVLQIEHRSTCLYQSAAGLWPPAGPHGRRFDS